MCKQAPIKSKPNQRTKPLQRNPETMETKVLHKTNIGVTV